MKAICGSSNHHHIRMALKFAKIRPFAIMLILGAILLYAILFYKGEESARFKAYTPGSNVLSVLRESRFTYSRSTASSPDQSFTNQTILIIMTQARSGSTFTGEIFAATDNSMYLYEPLFPYGLGCTFESEKEALLTKVLSCDFENLSDIYSIGFEKSGWVGSDYGKCVERSFCFLDKCRGLAQKYRRVCESWNKSQSTKENLAHCQNPLRADILTKICRTSSLLITKVNRICSLEEMDKIYNHLKTSGKEVYVLHLLRDMRSIAASIMKRPGDKFNKDYVHEIVNDRCPRQRHNVLREDTAFRDLSIIADGRYMRIRHEDLSKDAIGGAKRMFKFIGRRLPKEVVNNIRNRLLPDATILHDMETKEEARKKNRHLFKEYRDPTGVVRNAQFVLNEWRGLVPFDKVKEIQDKCSDVLEELDYVIFESEDQMKNLSMPSFKLEKGSSDRTISTPTT